MRPPRDRFLVYVFTKAGFGEMRGGVRRHPQERFGVREWLCREERFKTEELSFHL